MEQLGSRLPSIFLSYARGDDDAFVEQLYHDLADEGFDVWWDKTCLPSRSLTFHQEIRDAINARDRMLVVLGPKALRSEYVREEWQYALATEKIVTPIRRAETHNSVPPEMGAVHGPLVSATPVKTTRLNISPALTSVKMPASAMVAVRPVKVASTVTTPVPPSVMLAKTARLSSVSVRKSGIFFPWNCDSLLPARRRPPRVAVTESWRSAPCVE